MGNVLQFPSESESQFGVVEYYTQAFEGEFERQVTEFALQGGLQKTIEYALFPPGKRIRPLLSLLLCYDLGRSTDRLLSVCAALELVHAASLIHDDLPALDNDDIRRNRPSCHKACGEGLAVLAGDVLIACANQLVAISRFEAQEKLALQAALARAFIGLCNGQALDIESSDLPRDIEKIHRLKTGALFACVFEFAGISAGFNPQICSEMADIGEDVGLFFQMIDDLVDVYGDSSLRGKPQSSDQKNRKVTFVQGSSKAEKIKEVESKLTKIKQNLLKCLSNTVLQNSESLSSNDGESNSSSDFQKTVAFDASFYLLDLLAAKLKSI